MRDIASNEIKTYTNNIPHTWDFSVHCKDAQHSPKRKKWKVPININKSHLNFLHHFIIMTQCQCQNHSYPTIMPVLISPGLSLKFQVAGLYQADLATERESVDDGSCKSNNWLDQWQSWKLSTGSRVQSFLRAFPSSTDVPVLLLNQPINDTSWWGIQQLGILFGSIFLPFSYKSRRGSCL